MKANRIVYALIAATSSLLADPCIQGTPSHLELGTRQGKGMGYKHGYTTLSTFLTPNWQRDFQPLFDARVHFLNNATWASNVGGGLRFGLPSDFAVGGNFFYDFRNAKHITAHQLGAGLELLHPIFDVNVNGYVPIGRTKTEGSIKFDSVSGYHIFLKQRVAFALPHVEAMTGFWLPKSWPIDIYWAAGPYYLFGRSARLKSCGSTWGAKTFLEATITDGIVLGGQWTYDEEYHGRIQGYLSFSYPLGPNNIRRSGKRWSNWYKGECGQKAIKQRLLTGPVRRDEIIPICDKLDKPLPLSILPSVPDPAPPCYFVNNSLATDGDGTFENPFNNLASAESASAEGDCIYVYHGTGAIIPGYDTGFILKNDQTFNGSGFDFIIDGINVLPAQTPGQDPTISGTPGFAVTLANSNLINGFNFNGVAGITGTNIMGSTITNNTFIGQTFLSRAIEINTSTEDFFITNNTFIDLETAIEFFEQNTGAVVFSNNLISTTSASTSAIDYIQATIFDLGTLIFENNTIDLGVRNGNSDLFEIRSTTLTAVPNNLVIRNNNIRALSGPFNATIILEFAGSSVAPGGGTNIVIENNNITVSNFGSSIQLTASPPHLVLADITNNSIEDIRMPPSFFSGISVGGGSGNFCTNIDQNFLINQTIFLNQSAPGFHEVTPGSTATMSAANNGAPVFIGGTVNFNATLPQPQCSL